VGVGLAGQDGRPHPDHQQTPDRTILENRAFKAQVQATSNIRGSFTYFYGNKLKYGRDASATRPPETTYNQKGPSSFYKGEVNFVIGANLFLSARGSHFPTGFGVRPARRHGQGRVAGRQCRVARVVLELPERPAAADADGRGQLLPREARDQVRPLVAPRHRRLDLRGIEQDGNKVVTYHIGYPDFWVTAVSDWASKNRAYYTSAWVGDTISLNRATLRAASASTGRTTACCR